MIKSKSQGNVQNLAKTQKAKSPDDSTVELVRNRTGDSLVERDDAGKVLSITKFFVPIEDVQASLESQDNAAKAQADCPESLFNELSARAKYPVPSERAQKSESMQTFESAQTSENAHNAQPGLSLQQPNQAAVQSSLVADYKKFSYAHFNAALQARPDLDSPQAVDSTQTLNNADISLRPAPGYKPKPKQHKKHFQPQDIASDPLRNPQLAEKIANGQIKAQPKADGKQGKRGNSSNCVCGKPGKRCKRIELSEQASEKTLKQASEQALKQASEQALKQAQAPELLSSYIVQVSPKDSSWTPQKLALETVQESPGFGQVSPKAQGRALGSTLGTTLETAQGTSTEGVIYGASGDVHEYAPVSTQGKATVQEGQTTSSAAVDRDKVLAQTQTQAQAQAQDQVMAQVQIQDYDQEQVQNKDKESTIKSQASDLGNVEPGMLTGTSQLGNHSKAGTKRRNRAAAEATSLYWQEKREQHRLENLKRLEEAQTHHDVALNNQPDLFTPVKYGLDVSAKRVELINRVLGQPAPLIPANSYVAGSPGPVPNIDPNSEGFAQYPMAICDISFW